MAAETAYIMLGHGSEEPSNPASPNIIPPGCMLVVEVHSGELGFYSTFEHNNRIFSYKNKKIFLDPIGNYRELVNLMNHTEQSFAIYKPGDVYPNYKYYLLGSFPRGQSLFCATESGIIKYPFNYTGSKYGSLYKHPVSISSSSDIITDLYRMSVLPLKEEVDNFIKKNKYSTINKVLENNIKSNPDDERLSSLTELYQKEIFDKLGPGVYYNFVCRATTDKVRIKAEQYLAFHNEHNPLSYHINRSKNKINIKLNPIYRNSNINRSLYNLGTSQGLSDQLGFPKLDPSASNYTKRLNYQHLLKPFLNKQKSLPNKSNYITKEKIKAFLNSRKKHKFFIPEVRQLIEEAEWHRKPYIERLGFNTLNTIKTVDSEISTIMQKKEELIKNPLISNSLKQEKLIKYDNLLKAYNNQKVSIQIRNKIIELKDKISIINDSINMDESTKIQELEILNKELNEQESLLISLNSLKNTASNSYTWKKLKNKNGQLIKNNKGHFKWGKYTVKNKNNSPLPAGWTEYSNTNGTWYVSDFGDSTWNKPTENAKERVIETMPNTNLSGLSNNLSLANLASLGIYPSLAPPVIEQPVIKQPVIKQPVIEEPPSLNIVLDPSIKLSNSNSRGPLPVGWKYYFNKGQKLYISPTGKIYDKRPVIKISKVNSMGSLPAGWSYVTDGYTSWYKHSNGKIQEERPT